MSVNKMLCRHKNSLLFLQNPQRLETQKLQEVQLSSAPFLANAGKKKPKPKQKSAFLEAPGYSCSGHGASNEQDEERSTQTNTADPLLLLHPWASELQLWTPLMP